MCDLRERALKSQPKMPWYRIWLLRSSELIQSATSHTEECYGHDTMLLETRQSLHVYVCACRTQTYTYTLTDPQAHSSGKPPLCKNWSVMPRCSPGPSLLLVSGWPKAFKCFKLIITLMLPPPPPWALCLSVRKWNAIEIDAKMGYVQTFQGLLGIWRL